MTAKVSSFFSSIKNKKIGFIGLGVSHIDSVKLFCEYGMSVTVFDKRTAEQLGDVYNELLDLGVTFSLGDNYLYNLDSVDVIFRTPGMDYFSPYLSKARLMGKVVTSEMEVFFDLCPCKIYSITGSDGKTTTSTIISEFLKAQGKNVHLGGNIGTPLLPKINFINENDVVVVELSSFQLISMRLSADVSVITNISPNHLDVHKDMSEYIEAKLNSILHVELSSFQLISMRLSADVSVITNISPNHLDVHKDMSEYIEAKLNSILHQNAFSKTILNSDNKITMSFYKYVRGNIFEFSMNSPPFNGAYLSSDGYLCSVLNSDETKIVHKDEIIIPGLHNVQNYLAAIAATCNEVEPINMKKVATKFSGVEHRIEFVREYNNVKWYNDSIATSPTRTIAGLDSFDKKLILIMGGYDKNISFDALAPKLIEKAKCIILMGNTAEKIEKVLLNYKSYNKDSLKIIKVKNMDIAVNIASDIAEGGDIVFLSPACASFDMYKNFEVRGKHFKELVNALK